MNPTSSAWNLMPKARIVTIDGNEAAAYIAHMTSEVIAIYPITPSSAMGEYSETWSSQEVDARCVV